MKRLIRIISRVLYAFCLCMVLPLVSCENVFENGDDTSQVSGETTGGEGESNAAITNTAGGVTLSVSLRDITETGVTFYGKVQLAENYAADSFGMLYSLTEVFTAADAENVPIVDVYGTDYSVSTSSLKPAPCWTVTSAQLPQPLAMSVLSVCFTSEAARIRSSVRRTSAATHSPGPPSLGRQLYHQIYPTVLYHTLQLILQLSSLATPAMATGITPVIPLPIIPVGSRQKQPSRFTTRVLPVGAFLMASYGEMQ